MTRQITKEMAENFVSGIKDADFDGSLTDWFLEYGTNSPQNWSAFFRKVADALEGKE